MASLVESGMTNLHCGDADSVGFFQMRVGIWNQGEYAGYPEKPELQVKWFLDQAEAVKDARVAAGKPIDDPNSFGEWIADVERPAEQYRGRYQLQLDEAQGLLEERARRRRPRRRRRPPPAAVETPGQPAPPRSSRRRKAAGRRRRRRTPAARRCWRTRTSCSTRTRRRTSRDGAVDPRMLALLDKLTKKHKIELSVIKTGHDQFTSGGSVSNHFVGRGIDIARVDGEIVNPGSPAARELATEIAAHRPATCARPRSARRGRSRADGFFTDGGHQDHLHVAFDGEPPAGFKPPGAGRRRAGRAPRPPLPGQPAAAAAAAGPKPKPGDSMSFCAVKRRGAPRRPTPAQEGRLDAPSWRCSRRPGRRARWPRRARVPAAVADAATATASGSSSLGASALEVAKGELAKGVHEEGVNTGTDVDKYLAAAGVAPGNPWCASFVTWSLEQSGHKMEGGGWAGVQTWVRAAEAGTNDLQVVSADDARPGDIVTYDWGGQEDFGADGHIGFLASNVEGGKFTALEGNNQDAVMSVPRSTDQANVKFLRIGGKAPAGRARRRATAARRRARPARPSSRAAAAAPAPPAAVEPSGGGAADVAAAAADAAGPNPYPGDDAPKEQIAAWMAKRGREARAAAAAAAHGLARRVGHDEHPGRRRRLRRLLPDARRHLEPGRLRRLPRQARAAGQVVPRPGRSRSRRPASPPASRSTTPTLRRMDRRRRTPRRAVPRPLPAQARRGQRRCSAGRLRAARRGRRRRRAGRRRPRRPARAEQRRKRQGDDAVHGRQGARRRKDAQAPRDRAVHEGGRPRSRRGAAAAPGGAPRAPPPRPPPPRPARRRPRTRRRTRPSARPCPPASSRSQEVGPIGTYPGDKASQAELAKWLASEAKKAGLPPELPVMASLVESGVKNLKGGDADSAGFFQMRVGIWDKGPYKGYRTDPQLQAKWFIDNALAVKQQRLAAGQVRDRPGLVRRLDRRRRAARGAVPLPLPAAASARRASCCD